MSEKTDKRIDTIECIFCAILSLGNIFCAIDSFCEYAVTLKMKTLIKGIFFLVFIFYFAWQAIVQYKKLNKTKQKAGDDN